MTAEQKLRTKFVVSEHGCWIWQDKLDIGGYGRLRGRLAHRVVYETFVGPIPSGLVLDHLCRDTSCVNPAHLEPVTPAENTRRHFTRQTHCLRGHEYTPANTRLTKTGCRVCRKCATASERRARAQERERARAVMFA
jgi:hypothetical protein